MWRKCGEITKIEMYDYHYQIDLKDVNNDFSEFQTEIGRQVW